MDFGGLQTHGPFSIPPQQASSLSNADSMVLAAVDQPNSQCWEEAPNASCLESL